MLSDLGLTLNLSPLLRIVFWCSVRSLLPELAIMSVVWSMCLIRLCSSLLYLFLCGFFDFLLSFLLLLPESF